VETLRSIGVFRAFAPRRLGGLELDLPLAVQIISALSRVEGSVGWNVMIGSASPVFAPLLPRETLDRIYRNGPDAIMAGSAAPAGTAEAVEGGWRVSGRWPFASGCQHAEWMMGLCVVTERGTPIPGPVGNGGPPMLRGVVLPAHEWLIEDTWHVAGLKGTGSHHIVLTDRLVPSSHIADFFGGQPCEPGPLYRGLMPTLPLLHGAFAVGMAEGALDELVAMARTGRQQLRAAVPMRDSETFQFEVGRVAADVRAIRAVHQAQVAEHWRHALADTLRDEARYIENTQTAVWLATASTRAVDACFALGGGAALYETSPLQRRLRDMHAAAQHAAVQQRHYAGAGKLRLANAPG
jgi:alkylation response protein AidB-like acyl-CoA dehydrogenase